MFASKFKGIMLSIIVIVVALLLLPITVDSVHDAVTDTITDAFPGCVVAAGATDVVLTEDLYNNNVIWVTAITATGVGAVPVANTYTPATNTLNVNGLGADTPQDLTVTYDYEVNLEYAGVNAITGFIPLLVVIGLVIVAIINGLWAIKKGE